MKKILEIACFNLSSALIAQEAGANRIELCENYHEGGITPVDELINEARKKIKIELYVIIRPRAGNFLYSESEFELMKNQILFCKKTNIDGVSFGILTSDGEVDVTRCMELTELAKPMECTFHRAIDETNDLYEAIKNISDCGFTRILSSGGSNNAVNGSGQLQKMIELAAKQIKIMPGGGIRSENLMQLMNHTKANEFHSAAITDSSEITDKKEIQLMRLILDNN